MLSHNLLVSISQINRLTCSFSMYHIPFSMLRNFLFFSIFLYLPLFLSLNPSRVSFYCQSHRWMMPKRLSTKDKKKPSDFSDESRMTVLKRIIQSSELKIDCEMSWPLLPWTFSKPKHSVDAWTIDARTPGNISSTCLTLVAVIKYWKRTATVKRIPIQYWEFQLCCIRLKISKTIKLFICRTTFSLLS